MPTIAENRRIWGKDYGWAQRGDEWSDAWGSVASQWFWTVLPRIHPFVPCQTILEIAPGYGRWTAYLERLCRSLIAVDLNATCVEACKIRFADSPTVSCYQNDGYSLKMVPDGTVDFAFSFDSLVHAEADVIESYLHELKHKLKPDGAGFIHHSNVGACTLRFPLPKNLLGHLLKRLPTRGLFAFNHGRAFSMTAVRFREMTHEAGLVCISQERVNWRDHFCIDAFSTVCQPGSVWDRPYVGIRNRRFMDEAARAKSLSG